LGLLLQKSRGGGGCGKRIGGSLHQLYRVTHPRLDGHSLFCQSIHFPH
jgi:hypothetical protein